MNTVEPKDMVNPGEPGAKNWEQILHQQLKSMPVDSSQEAKHRMEIACLRGHIAMLEQQYDAFVVERHGWEVIRETLQKQVADLCKPIIAICCEKDCTAEAEHHIAFGDGPDDYTESCDAHLEELQDPSKPYNKITKIWGWHPDKLDAIAKSAYTAYGKAAEFKNFAGGPMPTWGDLPMNIIRYWYAAVKDVAKSTLT